MLVDCSRVFFEQAELLFDVCDTSGQSDVPNPYFLIACMYAAAT